MRVLPDASERVVTSDGRLTEQTRLYLLELRKVVEIVGTGTTGGTTIINNITNNTTTTIQNSGSISNPVGAGTKLVQKASVDFTTIGSRIYLIDKNITASLNATPTDQETVFLKNKGNGFTANGNGKLIDGHKSIVYRTKSICIMLVYSVETDDWSRI